MLKVRLRVVEKEDYFVIPMQEKQIEQFGYPAFIQPGGGPVGYEFAFQISSDEKACFNFVDNGRLYFFYNKDAQNWKLHYDFY